jgi:ABC-2 type transport system ATP-binding protein
VVVFQRAAVFLAGYFREKETAIAVNAMIEVHDLVKKFADFCAVDHISFTVAEGKIVGFLGPNGAGKITTIKMLTTVLNPTSGTFVSMGILEDDPKRTAHLVLFSLG